jgi:hypothetical protein
VELRSVGTPFTKSKPALAVLFGKVPKTACLQGFSSASRLTFAKSKGTFPKSSTPPAERGPDSSPLPAMTSNRLSVRSADTSNLPAHAHRVLGSSVSGHILCTRCPRARCPDPGWWSRFELRDGRRPGRVNRGHLRAETQPQSLRRSMHRHCRRGARRASPPQWSDARHSAVGAQDGWCGLTVHARRRRLPAHAATSAAVVLSIATPNARSQDRSLIGAGR